MPAVKLFKISIFKYYLKVFVHLRIKVMIINAFIHHSGSGISATVDAEDDLPELPTTNTTSKNGDAGDILWSNSPTPLLLSEYTNHRTAVESGRLITVALWIKISKKKKKRS